jgi:uncharacterized protein YndB with AHSA1/START domain
MEKTLTATATVSIHAAPDKVWKSMTTPALVKKYLMGADVITDWKEGSPISYQGSYNGKSYRDKGTILKVEPGKLLKSTYWSSMGGKEDKPENYNTVTYTLSPDGANTKVMLEQDNVLSKKEKEHVTKNWEAVLGKLKEVTEQ